MKGFSINWKTDSKDGGSHLNSSGAVKVTDFLGAYLHSHDPLPDHRGESAFSRWNRDDAKYKAQLHAA